MPISVDNSILTNPYLMSWSSDDGREDGSWSIVPGETGFTHAGSIVYDQSCNIVVTHLVFLLFSVLLKDTPRGSGAVALTVVEGMEETVGSASMS